MEEDTMQKNQLNLVLKWWQLDTTWDQQKVNFLPTSEEQRGLDIILYWVDLALGHRMILDTTIICIIKLIIVVFDRLQ